MTKKFGLFFMLLLMSSTSLFAQHEYEIVSIVPKEMMLTCSAAHDNIHLHQGGFISGSIIIEGKAYPFIYRIENDEFRLLKSLENANISVVSFNGMAAGSFNSYYYDSPGAFVYDFYADKLVDLRSMPELQLRPWNWEALAITEDNQFLFKSKDEEVGMIYDFSTHSISLLPYGLPQAANSKGQWIGGGFSYTTQSSSPGWFFDPQTGYQEIASLDLFNRWPVNPLYLTEGGLVMGTGLDSHANERMFLWDSREGLVAKMRDPGSIKAVNTLGQAVGTGDDQAFFYQPGGIVKKLGTLGGRYSEAYGLNDLGVVIGDSERKKYGNSYPFIWDQQKGMRDLTTLISPSAGWRKLRAVYDINNEGYILGQGVYYGVPQYFLLVPRN